jgi:hypothetical protein
MSTAAMFGIIAALGARNPASPTTVESQNPALIVVDPGAATTATATVAEPSEQPIQLTATPVVRAAQPAPALDTPVVRTNGSR